MWCCLVTCTYAPTITRRESDGPILHAHAPTCECNAMTFLHTHRPICAVLAEIREIALLNNDEYTVTLCDEAIKYAQRMSVKLTEYKNARDSSN